MSRAFWITMLFALGQTPAARPVDPARWTVLDPNGTAMAYLGRPSLFLDNGLALLKESAFADGTIEFDVAMHGHASFAGVAFRATSADNYELIYLRPHRSRQPDALQYTPIFDGSEAWQLYSGDGYTAAAEMPLNRWVHVRLVVAGYSARLFVDGAPEPQLVVSDLKRPWTSGQVGLWGRLGGAHFSNVVVTPATPAAAAARRTVPAAKDVLIDWELSPALDTGTARPDVLPNARTGWTPVTAEPSGMVNIAQYRKSVRTPGAPPRRDLVFASHVLNESRAGRARLSVAYSDAVQVFHNGKLLFAGESAFRSRDPAFLGIASIGPDVIYLDLAAGRNEIVLAVSETFGGWGFAAKLERQ